MSFMHVTCPWCGTNYTWGIVGSQMVGSGHECQADVACDTEGCETTARHLVAANRESDAVAFSCADHIGGRVIMSFQPRPLEPKPRFLGTIDADDYAKGARRS